MHMDTRSEKAWGKGTPTFKSSIVLAETRCMDCIRRLFLYKLGHYGPLPDKEHVQPNFITSSTCFLIMAESH